MTGAADSHGGYTMAYDSLNRVSVMQMALFGVTYTISYDEFQLPRCRDSFWRHDHVDYDSLSRPAGAWRISTSGSTPTRIRRGILRPQPGELTLTRYSDMPHNQIGDTLSTSMDVGRLTNLKHRDGSATTFGELLPYTYDTGSRAPRRRRSTGSDRSPGPTTRPTRSPRSRLAPAQPVERSSQRPTATMAGSTTGTGESVTNDGIYTYTMTMKGT